MDKQSRQDLIRNLLLRNEVHGQDQLLALMEAEGVSTTQATLSRDLRDLGAFKGPNGYQVPEPDAPRRELSALKSMLQAEVLAIHRSGTMVVVKTRPARASVLALEIENANLPQIVGTISDNNTLFLATHSTSQCGALARELRKIARR